MWDAEFGEPLTPPLKSSCALGGGGFLADGKYLVTHCTAETLAIWELPRDTRPVEDWVATASLLAARRINPAGFTEAVGAEALNEQWQRLHDRYPEDFQPENGFEPLQASSGIKFPPSSIRPVPAP